MNFQSRSINALLLVLLLAASTLAESQSVVPKSDSDKRSETSSTSETAKSANELIEELQQRLPFKLVLTPYLYNLILKEQLKYNAHPAAAADTSAEDWSSDYDNEEENTNNVNELENNEDSYSGFVQKRALSKKESPNEQRNRDLRRQQAARWDIGFGKRAAGGSMKTKSFMDALYGKRSGGLKHLSPKTSFGRKQQWDIQYGRK